MESSGLNCKVPWKEGHAAVSATLEEGSEQMATLSAFPAPQVASQACQLVKASSSPLCSTCTMHQIKIHRSQPCIKCWLPVLMDYN